MGIFLFKFNNYFGGWESLKLGNVVSKYALFNIGCVVYRYKDDNARNFFDVRENSRYCHNEGIVSISSDASPILSLKLFIHIQQKLFFMLNDKYSDLNCESK